MVSVAVDRFLWLLVGIGLVGMIFLWRFVSTRKEGFQVAPGVSIPTGQACETLETLLRPLEIKIPGVEIPMTPQLTQLRALYRKVSYEIGCVPEFADTVPIDPSVVCSIVQENKRMLSGQAASTPDQSEMVANTDILFERIQQVAGCSAVSEGQ